MKPALDQLAAKKRIRRFFDEPMAERRAVSYFIEEVAVCANVFVFGGALRDISLLGAPRFSSDVDTVVQVHDQDAFMGIMRQYDAVQNRFGGYRVRLGRWNFDVWEVARTWAFSAGEVEARSPLSLLETTFFNWDAILYDWRTGTLHHKSDYFSALSTKYLEIVLEANPNAVGALIRSLRTISLSDEIRTGPKLTRFIKKLLSMISNDQIMMYEVKSFANSHLSSSLLDGFRERAAIYAEEDQFQWLPKQQLCFLDAYSN